MKYLNNKNSRRRGIAMELAIMLLLVMAAVSTLLITTTMIHINKQKDSFSEIDKITEKIEKLEYDHIGKYFEKIVNEHFLSIGKEPEEGEVLYFPLPSPIGEETQYSEFTTPIKGELQGKLAEKYSSFIVTRNVTLEVNITLEISNPTDLEPIINRVNNIETEIDGIEYVYTIGYSLDIIKEEETVFSIKYIAKSIQQYLTEVKYTISEIQKEEKSIKFYTLTNNDTIEIKIKNNHYLQLFGNGDNALAGKLNIPEHDHFDQTGDFKIIANVDENSDATKELEFTYNDNGIVVNFVVNIVDEYQNEETMEEPNTWDIKIEKLINSYTEEEREKKDGSEISYCEVLQESKKINCTKWEYK